LNQWFRKIIWHCDETQAGYLNSTLSALLKSVNSFFGQFALRYTHGFQSAFSHHGLAPITLLKVIQVCIFWTTHISLQANGYKGLTSNCIGFDT